jgi:hypothetical protein
VDASPKETGSFWKSGVDFGIIVPLTFSIDLLLILSIGYVKDFFPGLARWLKPIILATEEEQIGRIMVRS